MEINPDSIKDFELIDVRGPDEFIGELGHIKGARLMTLGKDLDEYLQREDKHKKILFICRSGARSGKATEQALSLGFSRVYNMEGGMLLWNEKRYPVERNLSWELQASRHLG